MAVTTAKRKSSPPPEPKAWKDKPVNAEYEDKAKALLREHLEKTGNDYASLTEKLNSMGIKISRGSFSAAFLLQCVEALGLQSSAVA